MKKKAHKRSDPVKGLMQGIKKKGAARIPLNRPGIPDLSDALATAMARLKAAQISRLMDNAGTAALPEETAAGQVKVGGKKARKVARKARKQAEKAAGQARPSSDADPQISSLRAAA